MDCSNILPKRSAKAYLYPNIFDRSGFAEFATKYGLQIPYSRVALDKRELVEAYEDIVSVRGKESVWAKLAASGGGYGISRVSSIVEVEALYERLSSLGVLRLYGRAIPYGSRMSDSVSQVEAAKSLGINCDHPFAVIKLGPANCSITDVWQFLKGVHLSYDQYKKEGVIPFVWLEDKRSGGYASMIIAASDSGRLTRIYDLSVNAMRKEGVIN